MTVFMSSHILAEVTRLARRIGIIHKGHLIQELSADQLDRNRRRRLLIRTRDINATFQTLKAAGYPARIIKDETIEIKSEFSIEHPDDINKLLVKAGTPPTHLMVEEEELEQYFLRLVGMERGSQSE
jgi:ABC-2 type transport system ATP-binding protein